MPCRIELRHDQHSGLIPKSQRDGLTIYAPEWVREGLKILGKKLRGITFNVHDNSGEKIIETFTISQDGTVPLTLVQLQKIARNEQRNVTGVITKLNYDSIPDSVVYAIKDLVRQCIIVGLDEATHFGGYGSPRVQYKAPVPVYIVDLIGLQFQQPWNTGRLVLYKKGDGDVADENEGCLDQLIYEKVVGEPKKTFAQVDKLRREKAVASGRYVPVGVMADTYFDVVAYKKFVATDVMLCFQGLNLTVTETINANANVNDETKQQIHFKFLKYGAGYFAGHHCGSIIQQHILDGVIDGLEQALKTNAEAGPMRITSFEFPFFQESPGAKTRLDGLANKYSIAYKFGRSDALEMTAPPDAGDIGVQYTLATTNCADPHAATGNEMGFGSVDSVIAENLKSKGNIFNPLLNSKIKSQFIKLM